MLNFIRKTIRKFIRKHANVDAILAQFNKAIDALDALVDLKNAEIDAADETITRAQEARGEAMAERNRAIRAAEKIEAITR